MFVSFLSLTSFISPSRMECFCSEEIAPPSLTLAWRFLSLCPQFLFSPPTHTQKDKQRKLITPLSLLGMLTLGKGQYLCITAVVSLPGNDNPVPPGIIHIACHSSFSCLMLLHRSVYLLYHNSSSKQIAKDDQEFGAVCIFSGICMWPCFLTKLHQGPNVGIFKRKLFSNS